jgi:hypothetical protein
MKEDTQKLYELTVQAKDLFDESHSHISTSVGLMDKALRSKGINADAVTVDAVVSKDRLIFVLLDSDTKNVGIGLGNVVEDSINLVDQKPLNSLTPKVVTDIIIQHLT